MGYASALLAPVVHELGHWVAARLFGSRISFVFEWGKFHVPRWTWDWPDVSRGKLRIICLAGFGLEMALVPFMPWPYQLAAIVHFLVYPFYAGEKNDWKGVV